MPNHVTNELIFRDLSSAKVAVLLANIVNKDARIDFGILLPPPINAWQGNEGPLHEKTFPIMGMDWARKNWSTKRNAYGCKAPEVNESGLRLVFDTAWSPPFGWLLAVFNSQKVSFEHNWFDEGSDHSNHAIFNYAAVESNDWRSEPWVQRVSTDEQHARIHMLKYGVERFEDEDEGAV